MRFPGFIGQSYTLASINYECQRTLNMYPEVDELGTGKDGEVACLVGTPGLSLLATIGSGPIRGIWFTTTGVLYVVSGNTLYSVNSSWTYTSIGTLNTYSGQVSMSDNSLSLFVVDGLYGYTVNLSTGVFAPITDPNFIGSNLVTYQDGYFIFCAPNSKQFYLSDLNATTFSAPAYTSRNGNSDNVISIISNSRYLWLIGDRTTEIWFDAGANLNPFQYVNGTLSQYGSAATFSIAHINNQICWLGKDSNGLGVVYTNSNYTPQRISTLAVEKAIQGYSSISDAIGFAYQENGHQFYFLSFPTPNTTWCYDLTTGMWHERGYLNTSTGLIERSRANCYAYAYDTHVVGDYSSGAIYNQNLGVYTDNTNPILRQRVSPHISADNKRVVVTDIELDIESGVGLDGASTVQGKNPQAMLDFSNDGGHTWSNQYWASFGAEGQTRTRAKWRRLGWGRNRVFRISISDPVKVVMMGAEINLAVDSS